MQKILSTCITNKCNSVVTCNIAVSVDYRNNLNNATNT